MDKIKLIYVAYGNVSVFESQVVSLLNYYVNHNMITEVILILGIDYNAEFDEKKVKNLNKKITVKTYKQYPQYLLIEKLTIGSISKVFKKIKNVKDYIIHVRNDVLAHYVYRAMKSAGLHTGHIIADVRGAGFEQLIEFSDKNKLILLLKKAQRSQVSRSLVKINNLSVVSKSLKNYISEKVGKDVNIKINSCLANENFRFDNIVREVIRKKFNLKKEETLLVLSTGGDNAWQNTRETIKLLTDKKVKILNLSKTEILHDKVINLFVPYHEMFRYLCAADAAIIWRENGITNKVASPVKFSEYICCGLPVLTNNAVDLITTYIKTNNCGIIMNSLDSINGSVLNRLKILERNAISLEGQKQFGIDKIATQYVEFYKSL